jgi:hypothetical protein
MASLRVGGRDGTRSGSERGAKTRMCSYSWSLSKPACDRTSRCNSKPTTEPIGFQMGFGSPMHGFYSLYTFKQ